MKSILSLFALSMAVACGGTIDDPARFGFGNSAADGQTNDDDGPSACELKLEAAFTESCVGCHNADAGPRVDLTWDAGLPDRLLSTVAECPADAPLIDTDGGALMAWVDETVETCGFSRMPPTGPTLDQDTRDCLAEWVSALAATQQ